MSTYRISELLAPRSVVVVGGSKRETSVGLAVLKNIRQAGFAGSVHLVNSKHPRLLDVQAMHAVLAGRLPEGQVLSHDLLEGALARCATKALKSGSWAKAVATRRAIAALPWSEK